MLCCGAGLNIGRNDRRNTGRIIKESALLMASLLAKKLLTEGGLANALSVLQVFLGFGETLVVHRWPNHSHAKPIALQVRFRFRKKLGRDHLRD